ncbi:MAG: monovalent cation:proton antiporter-2 (CPA2) family protein [Alphaproteobacteria bacterium]|nr:monovalent cation:proton antiporter-2 (CPA2) family protein [Alphaproteobacteria bacterium]
MDDNRFLFEIVLLLSVAIVAVLLFRRLRISPMLGYLAGGLLVGPSGLALIADVEMIKLVGELGVAMLLFSIGLELSIKRLKLMRLEVFGLGTAQFILTATILAGIVYALGVSARGAFVIGAGLALSSTAIVLQLLSERREIASRLGRVSFAVLLLQDLAVVPLLAVVPILGTGATDWTAIALATGKAILALALIMVAGRIVLQPIYRTVARDLGPEVFVALTLLVVLGTGWATAQAGLSLTLGAFLAGLLLAETEFRHQIEADIKPFQGLLMGLFFMSIGMQVDLGVAAQNGWLIVLLTLGLIWLKTTILFGLCRLIKLPWMLAMRTGLMLSQGGEFTFILIGAAALVGVVPEPIRQICLAVVSASMILTPFIAIAGKALTDRLERSTPIGLAVIEKENLDLGKHVVIAGFGRVGRIVARLLESQRITYVAIDHDANNVLEARERGLPVYFGLAEKRDLLWGVGIDRASIFVVTLNDADTTLRLAASIKARLPELVVVARARDSRHARELFNVGADVAVPETLEASLVLGGAVLKHFDIGQGEIETALGALRADRGFLLDADWSPADKPAPPDAAEQTSEPELRSEPEQTDK